MRIALANCPVYCTYGLVEFVNATSGKWFNKIEKEVKKARIFIDNIKLHYRFVGYIEVPDVSTHRQNVRADTRQGVSVEYVPKATMHATA